MWNRITPLIILVTAVSLLFTQLEMEARGGGRGSGGRGGGGRSGGGSRGGGAYRGGHSMNRTPTMSRASNRPAASQARQRPQTRPSVSQGQRPQQRSQQRPQQRPSAANRTELRNQANRYAQSRPAPNMDRQAFAQKAQSFSSQRNNQMTQNRQISERTSQRLHQSRPNSNQWFDRNFFDHHNIDLDYVGTGANWWRPAAWATLATWGSWNWSTPYYYDEGYAYPITTTESAYSYNTTQTQPIESPQTTGGDWLPLGVFAIVSPIHADAQTNRFIQLAINRNGEIAGVLYNSTTDTAQDLTGMVNPNNQQVYWSMSNRIDSPMASTGIYNLMEDQTPINVHFSDGSDQTWTLIRLQQE